MIFGGSPMKTVAWVITEDLSQHYSEWMEMFRCGKEVVEILPIDLTWAGHEIDMTSGHEYKKNPRYTSCSNYWPYQFLKVWKHWVHNCGCGRVSKLLNCVLRWRHLTFALLGGCLNGFRTKYRKAKYRIAKYRTQNIESKISKSQNIETAEYRSRKISNRKISNTQNIEIAKYRIAKYRMAKYRIRKISTDKIANAKYRTQNIERKISKWHNIESKISKWQNIEHKISKWLNIERKILKWQNIERQNIEVAKYRTQNIEVAKYRKHNIEVAKYRKSCRFAPEWVRASRKKLSCFLSQDEEIGV